MIGSAVNDNNSYKILNIIQHWLHFSLSRSCSISCFQSATTCSQHLVHYLYCHHNPSSEISERVTMENWEAEVGKIVVLWKKMLSRLEQETWGEMSCCWQRGADRVQCSSSSIISTKTGAQECPQSTSTRVLTKAQLPLTAVYTAWSCLGPNYVIQAMLHFLQMLKFTILKACFKQVVCTTLTKGNVGKKIVIFHDFFVLISPETPPPPLMAKVVKNDHFS